MMVFDMIFEVPGKLIDSGCQKRHLDLDGTCVRFMQVELLYNSFLGFFR
jgi:hypothetical protein